MKKILVVEDEYYARKSIVKILQESDLDIQVCGEAANGMKAIELLEEYKDIALVITDIQMQKMGGLELASYLHKHIPEIDVLILTAFENFDYAREALRYNVKDYIVKPIYKENLLPPVKKVLEKQEEKSRNQEKIKNYYPYESIVGMIFDSVGDKKIVKSYAYQVFQHDLHTWMWEDNKFITANLSDYSKKFHIKIEDILNKFSKEEIKRFVNLFFTIIYNAGFVLKSELNKVDLVKIKNILKETSNLSNEDRKLLLEMFKAFINNSRQNNDNN